jgi:hypothetical protein
MMSSRKLSKKEIIFVVAFFIFFSLSAALCFSRLGVADRPLLLAPEDGGLDETATALRGEEAVIGPKVEKITDPSVLAPLNDSLSFVANDQLFRAEQEEFDVAARFTAQELAEKAAACGASRDKDVKYFQQLLSLYAGEKGIVYKFIYAGQSQDEGVWTATVLPNRTGYASVPELKSDFDLCAAGGDLYPFLVSPSYLMFESSCGTGADDGSGKAHGCELVKGAVEPTLRFK